MPGNVNNENILTAANQIVQAINDLVQELRDVQITINNQTGSGGGCCCCDDGEDLGGSTIQNDGGEEPYYGSEPPAEEEDRTGDPPDGFDSWDEYDQNKCNVAAAIVSGLAIWFRRFSQIQDVAFVTSGIVVGLAAGTVLAFPPAVIGLIVGMMVLLYVESQALEGLADDIETNKDELQCGIYNTLSSTAAIDFLRSKLGIFIDNRFPATVAWAAKKLITFVITVDTTNKAFVDKIGQNLPDADCSACTVEPIFPFTSDLEGWQLTQDMHPDVATGENFGGEILEWSEDDPTTGSLLMTTGSPPTTACVISPSLAYEVTENTILDVDFKVHNVTENIYFEWSTGGADAIRGDSTSYNDGQIIVNLTSHAGKTLKRIWWPVGAGAYGRRTLRVRYLDVKESV